jgi:hypothetical protein
MLRSVKDLSDYAIRASDGDIGHIRDFFFDDHAWAVRYFVVDTGSWLMSRKVLISPVAVGKTDWEHRVLPVAVTKAQVRASPDIDTQKPVSRQHEMEYLGYYGYPYYWGGGGLWGLNDYPSLAMPAMGATESTLLASRREEDRELERAREQRLRDQDPHLRSARAVMTYRVHAADGDIGHVEDFLVDVETWALRYLVVSTSNWWMGHKVLVAPQWIHSVDWLDNRVSVDLGREAIQSAPRFENAEALDRQLETETFNHYGRADYWSADAPRDAAAARRIE